MSDEITSDRSRLAATILRAACLLVAVALGACASIPMSTLARMSRLDATSMTTLDGADLRLRVSLPLGYALDAASSRLALRLSGGGTTRESDFQLEIVSTAPHQVSSGLMGGMRPATAYTLRLTPASLREFALMQQSMREHPVNDVDVDVRVALSDAPKGVTAAPVWVDLALSRDEGFFPLVENGMLPLDGRTVRESNRK